VQWLHTDRPEFENDPGEHKVQVLMFDAPVTLEYDPAKQRLHDNEPFAKEYEPGVHERHKLTFEIPDTFEKVPGTHDKQTDDPLKSE